MIAEKATTYEVESTIKGKTIQMGIKAHALGKIMSVLTDMYSDRQMAVLREYATNALDAQIEAGINRPIEITLPSQLAPFLKIKDYGVGLSAEDIERVYSQYGESTKDESNDYNGMLGIGCKSALTYTSQFSVVSIKDGVRVMVSISRDDTGIASMTIVGEPETTDEPNGTEVIVPAGRDNRFERKAKKLFAYWGEGTVLVNGEEPEKVDGLELIFKRRSKTVEIDGKPKTITLHRLVVADDSDGDGHMVVMAGVPYPAKLYPISLGGNNRVVAYVGIGDLHFAPSREALTDTRLTKETLRFIEEEFQTNIGTAIQRNIDKVNTPREALKIAALWRDAVKVKGFEWKFKGEVIPLSFTPPMSKEERVAVKTGDDGKTINVTELVDVRHPWTVTERNSSKLSKTSQDTSVYAGTALRALWVYGYDYAKFTPSHKRKLQQFCADNDIDATTFILHKEKIDSPWIEDRLIVPWEPIRAIKLEVHRTNVKSNRPSGSYDLYDETGNFCVGVVATDIDTTKPLFYINKTSYGEGYVENQQLRKSFPSCTLVELTSNRVAKFCRDFPEARNFTEGFKDEHKKLRPKITKANLLSYALLKDSSLCSNLRQLDPSRIDDPELKHMIKVARGKSLSVKVKQRIERCDWLARTIGKPSLTYGLKFRNPEDRYPFAKFDTYNMGGMAKHEHIYIYLNAVYAAEQQKENS